MSGNYAQIAEGMGAVGITVTQPGEVAGALMQARQHNAEGRTVLIDIHTNLEARRSTSRHQGTATDAGRTAVRPRTYGAKVLS